MTPYLSIIVPVYNVEAYIDKCIKSILNQTFEDFELILVDDGSPDNCGKICDTYASLDQRIKVIHQNNSGLSSARNTGLKYSTGKYIAFCDSDDYIDARMYEILIDAQKKYDADIVKCGCNRFIQNKITSTKNFDEFQVIKTTKKNPFLLSLYYSNTLYIVVWNAIYRSNIVKNITFPEGFINEDQYASGMYLFQAKTLVTVDKPLYFYRQNFDGLSKKEAPMKKPLDALVTLSMLHEELLKRGLPSNDYFLRKIKKSIAVHVYKTARQGYFILYMDKSLYEFLLKHLDIRRKLRVMWYKYKGIITFKENPYRYNTRK